jgi:hypothetical protein
MFHNSFRMNIDGFAVLDLVYRALWTNPDAPATNEFGADGIDIVSLDVVHRWARVGIVLAGARRGHEVPCARLEPSRVNGVDYRLA